MRCFSTRGQSPTVSLQAAILQGMPADNGLYLPETIPSLSPETIAQLPGYSFEDLAFALAEPWFREEMEAPALRAIIADTLAFDAPLREVAPGMLVLELFHGPTLAFKDFGARFMARVVRHWAGTDARPLHVLVATSGDTGSAVAHGFWRVPGTQVTVLYPHGRVSALQERQFATLGENVQAIAVEGTFDDCQRLVKQAFTDADLREQVRLSSANSINLARLLPQMFYYARAWQQWQTTFAPHYREEATWVVPSGNVGNLTAGLFARQMGVPISRLMAAMNANRAFADWTQTGIFEPQPTVATLSNAMDVGSPSNAERIRALLGDAPAQIAQSLSACTISDADTLATLREVYETTGYLMCPHTAVGYTAAQRYVLPAGQPAIVLATAHPAKFADVIEAHTGIPVEIPPVLAQLADRPLLSERMENDYARLREILMAAP